MYQSLSWCIVPLGFDTLDQFRPTANVSNAMFEAPAAGLADKIAKKIISWFYYGAENDDGKQGSITTWITLQFQGALSSNICWENMWTNALLSW